MKKKGNLFFWRSAVRRISQIASSKPISSAIALFREFIKPACQMGSFCGRWLLGGIRGRRHNTRKDGIHTLGNLT
jgi:hypothetical protein